MRTIQFCFRDFSGKLITDRKMPFVDATGMTITPSVGMPFVDGRGRLCLVGQPFFDFSGELIEPR